MVSYSTINGSYFSEGGRCLPATPFLRTARRLPSPLNSLQTLWLGAAIAQPLLLLPIAFLKNPLPRGSGLGAPAMDRGSLMRAGSSLSGILVIIER